MAIIAPTITAENAHQYREQVERVQGFANHLHIDLMDGVFTSNKSVDLEQLWLLDNITYDIHIMFQNPEEAFEEIKKLNICLFIVPVESDCDFKKLAQEVKKSNIQFGVALLAETPVESVRDIITLADHVLIFSGNLGYQGGSKADLSLLSKIDEVKAINPSVEIGWDGGVNEQNVKQISEAGVDVINVGSGIHYSKNPVEAYSRLQQLVA